MILMLLFLIACTENKHSFGLDTEFGESVVRFFAESELEKTEWLHELTTIKKKMDGDRAAREGTFFLLVAGFTIANFSNLGLVSRYHQQSDQKEGSHPRTGVEACDINAWYAYLQRRRGHHCA